MATLYGSTGDTLNDGISVDLAVIEARLLKQGYDTENGLTHSDRAPTFTEVHAWPKYVLLQVFENEPKTTLFPKSGFYHLRKLHLP
jgi:hypothetical protein